MRLRAAEVVAAPVEAAWAGLVDVDRLERRARERDPALRRVPEGPAGPGTRWEMRVPVQGRARRVTLEIVEMEPPRLVRMRALVEGIVLRSALTLEPLDAHRTALRLVADAEAAGLAGRLLLGALSLAQGQVERRLASGLAAAARRIERERGAG